MTRRTSRVANGWRRWNRSLPGNQADRSALGLIALHVEQPASKRREPTMTACMHPRTESYEQHEDDMHCAGWICTDCGQRGVGDCHPLSWCRPDFCGAEPARAEVPTLSTVSG